MLLTSDLTATATDLAVGVLHCPHHACDGKLAPWGHARTRYRRVGPSTTEAHTPRRTRCRSCQRTHVIASTRNYPRRPDTAETIGAALTAAARGLGHRRIAEAIGIPATTVRGWIRRARANSENVRANATIRALALDPVAATFDPTGTPLSDMIDAVGRAVSAYICRLGPGPPPWQLAVLITRAEILAPRPSPVRYLTG